MNRLLSLLAFTILCKLSFAQSTQVTISQPETQVIYYGIDNFFTVQLLDTTIALDVTCLGCDTILETKIKGTFKFNLVQAKEVIVQVKNKATKELLAESTFDVHHLPDPTLFLGSTKAGFRDKINSDILIAKYPSDFVLDLQFSIVNYDVFIGERFWNGTGSQLTSEIMKAINTAKPRSVVSVICTVQGPDGIKRRITAVFQQ